jgi:hypothetical protein
MMLPVLSRDVELRRVLCVYTLYTTWLILARWAGQEHEAYNVPTILLLSTHSGVASKAFSILSSPLGRRLTPTLQMGQLEPHT